MKDYKRLTKSYRGQPLHTDTEVTDGDEIYERLELLENKIENGTLIELPCKVGDTVWFLNKHYAIYLRKDTVYKAKVVRVYFEKNKNIYLAIQIKNEYGTTEFPRITEIDKTVFLTQAEAEKKLKELNGGKQ